MNKPTPQHTAVVYGGGLVCGLGKTLRDVAELCRMIAECPEATDELPLARPPLHWSFNAAVDEAIAPGPPPGLSACSVFLIIPDDPDFDPTPFVLELEVRVRARLGVAEPTVTSIRGQDIGLRALVAAIHATRTARTDTTAVLIAGIQDTREHLEIEPAAAALLIAKTPSGDAYTEIAGVSTGCEAPIESALSDALAMGATSMQDIDTLVVDCFAWAMTCQTVSEIAASMDPARAEPRSLWGTVGMLEDLGAVSGLASFLVACETTRLSEPNTQNLWVARDGDHAALLRQRGPAAP